ncbi:hypothetical protein Ndes2526B_g03277 [Nannochloris sp. 'desiccata']|nr:hypothetical protein KSW81_006506 [Chlorella desiccata (nom. nud.)]
MLKRFFCLGPSHHASDGEWVVARTQHHQTQALYAASKILDIVEAEVDERFKSNKGYKRAALEPNSMRRLHRANLPMEDSQRATEIISKLTSIDNSKLRFQKEYARMEQEIAEVKEDKRLAEFAQARAEQLAIARGEALYKCQERLTEAERQQVQLADVLKLTLDKLGMRLTPSPAPTASQEYERSPGQLLDRPAGPLFASAHGLAIDRSATMLAPRNTTEVALYPKQQYSSSASEPDTPLSGFTVYSNELHDSPGAAGARPDSRAHSPTYYNNNNSDNAKDNEQQYQQQRQYLEKPRPSSATKWKDISEVVQRRSNSQSPDCTTPLGPAAMHVNGNNSTLAVSGANSGQLDADSEADKLAKLIIPHLQASQLESLVRFGASLGSPALASPTMQRHLMDAIRKSRTEERAEYHERMHQQEQKLLPAPQMPVAHHAPPRAPENAVPSLPAPAQCLQARPPMQQHGGPLSQATGWTSPGLNGSPAHHIKTVFENAPSGSGVGTGGENGFYKPFSAAATTAPDTKTNNQKNQTRDGVAMPAPRPKKTTFKIITAAAPPGQQQHAGSSSLSQDGDTIKAVMQQQFQHDGSINTNDAVPEDDRFARQRRAAERLAAKINSKLPLEYRTADPLGLGNKGYHQMSRDASATNVVASRATSSTSTSSGGSGTGGTRAPKGSLRRQQAEGTYRWGN